MLGGGALARGSEQRCRTAIGLSFSNFPDIVNQVRLWFAKGLSWEQIQVDLLNTFSTPRDVTEAYTKTLAKLQYGPSFATACRDLFVVHQDLFYRRPHMLVSFVESVVERLPDGIREAVIRRLSDEVDDSFWQLARPFWEPSSSDTILELIERRMRSETAVRDLKLKHSKTQSSVVGNKDRAFKVTEGTNFRPSKPQGPGQQAQQASWLDEWVSRQPSVWHVETDKSEAIERLRGKALEVKGPLRRSGRSYFFMSFKDEGSAKTALEGVLAPAEFRPFVSKNA
jgi:hypothetical protein